MISKILLGETQLYTVLVDRYRNFVFTIALRYTPVREDAEEIAQDTFVKAFRSLSDFRGDSKFSTWLYTIVNSTSLTFLRKKKQDNYSLDNEKIFDIATSKADGTTASQAEQKSKAEMVNQSIQLLNADDARLITLFYKAEQSLEEIARIMNIEPNNVKIKLYRARQRLREKMKLCFPQDVKDLTY